MPTFRIKETQVTATPTITVQTVPPAPAPADAAERTLRVGVHRFQLVVEDNDGNRSAPAFVEVEVVPRRIIRDPRLDNLGGPVGPVGPIRPS